MNLLNILKCLILVFGVSVLMINCKTPQKEADPVAVIFDTDMGPDYDDVGAIAMLHAFADNGEATILATVASTKYGNVAAVLNVLNTYFKRPDLPIAVPKGDALTLRDFQHWSDTLIERYPHTIKTNDDVPDAVSLYRRILADQPDGSVTIITVGFLTNIADLLKSSADETSSLTGSELVNKKVKQLVSMAGKFPEGTEFNVEQDAAASKYVFDNIQIPVLLSGVEIGQKIKSGIPLINNADIQNSPVKDAFRISIPMAEEDREGRMSWDQSAVLVGVRGYEPYYRVQRGTMQVKEDGGNGWRNDNGRHGHLIEARPPSEVETIINQLMMHQPGTAIR